ncbi:Nup85 nucleoporin-domain-containing protein [Chlamydoabsidia padenii]|nr:Nup85 nucleoporin-domain-containing protein [Chlamydoabsidia padenii]
MVVSIFTPSLSTPHVYKKRPKFYHQTAQVYRLLHGIYSTEVNMVKQLQGLDSTSTLDAFVGVYTDLINDYCVDIQYDKGDEANQERLCYQKINFIWQLLQVLYFSGSKTEEKHCYGTQLMTWLNRLDKRAILQFDIQGVFNSPIPSRHASFWLMVYKLTLRGELDSLQQLVQVASERAPDLQEKAILQTVARTIRFFPGLTSSANNNITTDMKSRRKLWKSKATEGLQVLVGHEKDRSTLVSFATTVIHIMLGDITTICQYTLSSVESAVASIYYYSDNNTNTMTIGMINKITRRVHQLRDNNSKNEHDQHVGLLSLLKGDIYEALEQFAQLDWWLLAHAMDILEEDMLQHQRDGLLDNKPLQIHLGDGQHKVDMDARSFFVLTYAHALVTQDGMWETALDYMGTCGEVGKTEINKVCKQNAHKHK